MITVRNRNIFFAGVYVVSVCLQYLSDLPYTEDYKQFISTPLYAVVWAVVGPAMLVNTSVSGCDATK